MLLKRRQAKRRMSLKSRSWRQRKRLKIELVSKSWKPRIKFKPKSMTL